MTISKLHLLILLPLLIGSTLSFGCATKKYVRERVDERVTPLENRTGELEETARRNSADISRLNSEVADAKSRADRAQSTADAAQIAANTAKETAAEASNRANRVNTRVDNLVENIDAYNLSRTVTVNFRLNRWNLDEEARAELDALAAELQGKKGFVIEIQGFTDSTGSDARNRALSQRRAQSVFQYLAEVHNLPIFRMHILGLGEGRPIAENNTRTGRAQNRRVEVRLLTTELQD